MKEPSMFGLVCVLPFPFILAFGLMKSKRGRKRNRNRKPPRLTQMVENPPPMQDTWVWSLGWEDSLEKRMATHSSILAWSIPWTEESGGLQSMGSWRVGHDWATFTFLTFLGWWKIGGREKNQKNKRDRKSATLAGKKDQLLVELWNNKFLGSKITVDSDYNHKVKRYLFLGRKAMPNLDSILKSRDITLPTKVYIVKAMLFPVVM